MARKIAVVTGATGGIGKEIARGLARQGLTVVIGARTAARGEAARADIAATTGNADVHVLPLDVADPASVRDFAHEVEARFPRVDVLVNNAGAWFTDRRETVRGHELTFATNVLGPYLLTKLLADRLAAAGDARVVNVVSAFSSNYDATDLGWIRRPYDGFKAYAQSKAALRMITWHFADLLRGKGVTANAVSPGFVRTDFNQNARGFMAALIGLSARLFATTPEKGAETPLWAATSAALAGVTGNMYEALKEKEPGFEDRAVIADLVQRCEAMASGAPQLSLEKLHQRAHATARTA